MAQGATIGSHFDLAVLPTSRASRRAIGAEAAMLQIWQSLRYANAIQKPQSFAGLYLDAKEVDLENDRVSSSSVTPSQVDIQQWSDSICDVSYELTDCPCEVARIEVACCSHLDQRR